MKLSPIPLKDEAKLCEEFFEESRSQEDREDLFKIRSCMEEDLPITQSMIIGRLPEVRMEINNTLLKLQEQHPNLKFYVLRETRLDDFIFPALVESE